ncbi:MAG: UDP-N-acetylmuramoyl-L-alanyl-D-glutamate--2,6-diaminopimelate ligase [Candidatus Paceibacterota bacterium]
MQNFIKKLKIGRLKRKMIAILAELHLYSKYSKGLKIVGITGTNGKTTTADLLYKIAIGLGYKAGFIGTTGTLINGEEFKMERKIPTTPDVLSLNKIFSEMKKQNCEYVFMEVSSHALDQKRVAGVKFIGGIFTNLTHDHLDYHKNFENYFKAKKKFFKMLPKSAFALVNGDDEYCKRMLEDIKAKKYLYGFNKKGDFYGEILKISFDGIKLKVNELARLHNISGAGGDIIQSKLLGKFNAYNLLSVWSACRLLNFDMGKVKKNLENIEAPKGRFDHFVSAGGILGIVDYAHSPDSLEKVLNTINEFKDEYSKIITVFGCGGDRDPMKRKVMGKIGTTFSDIAIFTSDNSRSEDPEKIINEMKEDLTIIDLEKVKSISNRHEAIKEAVSLAGKGDIILLAGKGHENYQEIKGVRYHFDDMEELKKNLN